VSVSLLACDVNALNNQWSKVSNILTLELSNIHSNSNQEVSRMRYPSAMHASQSTAGKFIKDF